MKRRTSEQPEAMSGKRLSMRRVMFRSFAVLFLVIVILSSTAERADAQVFLPGDILLPAGVVLSHLDDIDDVITGALFDKALGGLASWFVDDTAPVVNYVLWKITTASTPVVSGSTQDGDWFALQYQMMMNVGWWMMLPLLFVTILHSIFKGSMQLLLRSVCMYLPIAVIGTVVATKIIQLLIIIVDDMCAVFVNLVAQDLANFSAGLTDNLATGVLGVVLGGVLGFVLIVFSLYLWIVFLLRDGSIYLAVMFMPVGFAMMVWPATISYARKMIQFLVGIVIAKLAMVVVISVSVAGLAGATGAVTAGAKALYPDGSIVATNDFLGAGPDGKVGTADDEVDKNNDNELFVMLFDPGAAKDGAKDFWTGLGFAIPAVVMLGLAALSPPMVIKLIGNMGIGEMASQIADTLNTQAWLYQYIGMERQTKIWFRQPKYIYDGVKAAGNQKKALKNTSQQEKMLNSMGIYRKENGTFRITKEELLREGWADDKLTDWLVAATNPNKNGTDANLVAAAHIARQQGPDGLFNIYGGDMDAGGIVIETTGGGEIIVPDIVDRVTHAPLRHLDSHYLARLIDYRAQGQMGRYDEIRGINVVSPVQMKMDQFGRYVGPNKQQQSLAKKYDGVIRNSRNKWGSKNIFVTHYARVSVSDKVHRELDDDVEHYRHPQQGDAERRRRDYDLAG